MIAVDWSGARTGEHRKIWLADVVRGELIRLCDGWSRASVTAELVRVVEGARTARERVVIGLDFSFGFPAWYAEANGWRAGREVWRAFTDAHVEQLLREPVFPFWGRGAVRSKPLALHADSATSPLRETERRSAAPGRTPFSVFQLVGAGAVGPASLRGMATVRALSEAGACIWPFDFDDGSASAVVTEIWPRWFAPDVNKSNAQARVDHVESIIAWRGELSHAMRDVRTSDDAFDALVSALSIWDARAQLAHMPTPPSELARVEGWIWRPHAE